MRRRTVVPFRAALAAALAVFFVALGANAPVANAAVCADYSNQAAAQRAQDTRDADGDGIYCETLPCPCARRGNQTSTPKPVAKPRRRRSQSRPARHTPRVLRAQAVIVHVVDGDTIRVRTSASGRSAGVRSIETIRLIGIDTPESVRPGTPVECGAREAKSNMLRIAFGDEARDTDDDGFADEDALNPLDVGALVTIKTDATQDRRDRYGRLLAYVNASHTGVDVAERQLAAGWASVFVFDRPFQRVRGYRRAASAARDAGRGDWSTCGGDFHSSR